METHTERHNMPPVQFSGPGGSGGASGGGMTSGGGGGSGGGSGGAFMAPNLILDLSVKTSKSKGNQQLLCAIGGPVRAIDDQGRALSSPDGIMPGMKQFMPGVDYSQEFDKTAIHLFLPPESRGSKYLQSLDCELQVAEGTVNQFAFSDDDISKKSVKHGEGLSAKVDDVTQSPDGVAVTIALEKKKKSKSGLVAAVLIDSQGKKHFGEFVGGNDASETSSSGSNNTTNANGGSSWSSHSGSSSGGSSGGGSFGPGGTGTQTWKMGDSGAAGSNDKKTSKDKKAADGKKASKEKNAWPTVNFKFDSLPDGVSVKSINCTFGTFTTEPKTVPFHFDQIPLADMEAE
jgi:hypothetical protein